MCLYPSQFDTDHLKKRLRRSRSHSIIVWKELTTIGDDPIIVTPWENVEVKLDKDGFFKSDRKSTKITTKERRICSLGQISKGIHVYLEKRNGCCVPCRAYLKDFVAAEAHEAVFTKIKFHKKALVNFLKRITSGE